MMCVYHYEHEKNKLEKSIIHRFLEKNLNREELQNLHDQVIRNEEEVLQSIEEEWIDFQVDEKQEWPDHHWDQLQKKIAPVVSEDQSSNVFRLQWWVKVAAALLVVVSVWFGYKSQTNPQISSDSDPTLITEVNDSNDPSIVILQDGTKVTLTAHSSISYYDNFNHKYRVVHLNGEAYFETDGENKRPFVVISENITSICRGEEFSISAYKDSNEINVTLASGQIEISRNDKLNSENNKVAVKSCQRYSFNKTSDEYLIGQISDCEYDDKARSMKKAASNNIVML
jgi:transmembrane sensor